MPSACWRSLALALDPLCLLGKEHCACPGFQGPFSPCPTLPRKSGGLRSSCILGLVFLRAFACCPSQPTSLPEQLSMQSNHGESQGKKVGRYEMCLAVSFAQLCSHCDGEGHHSSLLWVVPLGRTFRDDVGHVDQLSPVAVV